MRLAIIGTGKIVAEALHALTAVKNIELTAIFGRPHSLEKASTFAEKYQIPEVYTDYAKLLEETAADTVYIGLVNSAHYPYAKQALLAGKNVILEKPFTGFVDEAKELQQIAEEKKLFIFEAVTVLHSDIYARMQSNVKRLGPVKMALCNYSQYSSRYDNYMKGKIEPAFDPKLYGGALYDINVYNIHYCVALFGAPVDVDYYPNLGPNGIDTSGTLVMRYDGFSAVCTGAKDSDSPCYISIQGEKGYMKIDGKPNSATGLLTVYDDENNTERIKDAAGGMSKPVVRDDYQAPEPFHRMTPEFTDFADIIEKKNYEKAASLLGETIAVMEVLEKARTKAGIVFE